MRTWLTFIFLSGFALHAQTSLILNDESRVVMSGGTSVSSVFVVVNNSNTGAIITTGTGGAIVSESEFNRVRMLHSNSVGTVVVPFVSANGLLDEDIPVTVDITSSGTSTGHIDYSTWETADNNSIWPSDVTHLTNATTGMASDGTNLVDRFWVIDAASYVTKPSATIQLSYNDNNEIEGTNGITSANESMLVAQKFNPTSGTWNGTATGISGLYGNWIAPNRVEDIVVDNTSFHASWAISLSNQALPVEYTNIMVECENEERKVTWQCGSETNNDFFEIEHSADGSIFQYFDRINGSGNTVSATAYQLSVPNTTEFSYIRLVQQDFDGHRAISKIVTADLCEENQTDLIHVYSSNEGLVIVNRGRSIPSLITVYDVTGRLIYEKTNVFLNGKTNLRDINVNGIAVIKITGESYSKTYKLYLN